MVDRLVVRGAREHNLKGVDIDVPRDSMIVFTGLSGSVRRYSSTLMRWKAGSLMPYGTASTSAPC